MRRPVLVRALWVLAVLVLLMTIGEPYFGVWR